MTEAAESQVQEQQQDQKDEVTERAERMGWQPKDKFKGDPEKWVDARQFVENGERIVPIMRERLKKQDTEMQELRQSLKDMHSLVARGEERGYKKAVAELEARRDRAIEEGDKEGVKAVDKEMRELEADRPPKQSKEPKDDLEPGRKWFRDNPIFTSDPDLQDYLWGACQRLAQQGVGGVDQLEKAAAMAKKVFPHKFSNPKRDEPNAVIGGGSGEARGGKTGKGYSDLPADAKAACDRFVSQKVMTREQYLKDYFGD